MEVGSEPDQSEGEEEAIPHTFHGSWLKAWSVWGWRGSYTSHISWNLAQSLIYNLMEKSRFIPHTFHGSWLKAYQSEGEEEAIPHTFHGSWLKAWFIIWWRRRGYTSHISRKLAQSLIYSLKEKRGLYLTCFMEVASKSDQPEGEEEAIHYAGELHWVGYERITNAGIIILLL